MQLNRKTGFALFLIGCGALILLDRLGLGLGNLISFIFPVLLIGFGYIGIKNERKVLGWGLVIVGAIMLLGKLSGLAGLIIAGALIAYGFRILKRSKAY